MEDLWCWLEAVSLREGSEHRLSENQGRKEVKEERDEFSKENRTLRAVWG